MKSKHARPSITLDQLHTFLTVAETGNQRRAAEELHLSGAAVSEQLRLLEMRLGVRLFERRGRGTHLTEPGKALVEGARAALQDVWAVESIAFAHRGLEQGRLTVAAGHALAQYRIPTWLREFFGRHPKIEIELRVISTAAAVGALSEGAVDLALIGGEVPVERFESILLERAELVIAVASGHPLASSRDVPADLKSHRYLMRGEGSGTEQLAQALLGQVYLAGPVQRLGLGAVPLALLAGLGYAVMPAFVVEPWVEQGRVVILPHRRRAVYQVFHALRRRGPQAPASDAFWKYLSEAAVP
jgi:DNA-binding transcriptional LysR family regulator